MRVLLTVSGLLVGLAACGMPDDTSFATSVDTPPAATELPVSPPVLPTRPTPILLATPTPVGPPPTIANFPTPEPTITPQPTTLPPALLGGPLGELEGPQLLMVSEREHDYWHGLMLSVSDDGWQGYKITDQLAPTRNVDVAPGGGHIAYMASDPEYQNLRLVIARLPDLDMPIKTIPLLSWLSGEDLVNATSNPFGDTFQGIIAVTSSEIAWSPDGRRLAFMAMIDGPTSDLYVYSLDDGSVTQLTDGPSQAIRPTWSPNGRYIAHAGVYHFGTGAGYGMAGVWAVDTVEDTIVSLGSGFLAGDDLFAGWFAPATLVRYSWNVDCGWRDLRTVNLETGAKKMLWGEFFDVKIVGSDGKILVGVTESLARCNEEDTRSGVFLADLYSAAPPRQIIEQFEALDLSWRSSLESFLVATEAGAWQIHADGSQTAFPALDGRLPAIAPGGNWLAWALPDNSPTPGLWLGTFDETARPIYEQGAYRLSWHPSGQRLFFFGQEGLYMAEEPDFEPVLVQPNLGILQMRWVIP